MPTASHNTADLSHRLMKIGGLSIALALTAQVVSAASAQAQAQAQPGGIPGPTYAESLGIGLKGWPYPYPVQFMPLEIRGQRLRRISPPPAPQTGAPSCFCIGGTLTARAISAALGRWRAVE
jgi:hypothetical protein